MSWATTQSTLGLLLFCFWGVSVAHATADLELTNRRIRLESISQELEYSIKASGRQVQNDQLEHYIERVIERIDPENGKNFNVIVSRDHEANAWVNALPVIHVTTGLLTLLDNEAQLAFILAHEIEHYTSGSVVDAFYYKLEQLQTGITLSYRINALFQSGAYNREQETLADEVAILAYLRAGYSPEEIKPLFNLFQQLQIADRSERSTSILDGLLVKAQSHPDPQVRLQNITETLATYAGKIGSYIGKKEYLQVTRPVWIAEINSSLLIRDGSRLRLYFSQANAKTRYGNLMYFYIAEAFRLGGTDEERKRLLAYYIAALQKLPNFATTYRALARLRWRQNDRAAAARYYRQYLSISDENVLPDYLGQDLGLLEAHPLAQPINEKTPDCDSNRFISEVGYFSIQMPCDWYMEENTAYSVAASKDGWGLNRISVYSVPYDFLLDSIDETVSLAKDGSWAPAESGDDKLDVVEMCRAAKIKESDYPVYPAGTGFESINNRRWGWYEITGRDAHGLTYRAREYVTVVGSFIITAAYRAPDLYYYQAGLAAFGQTLSTLMIINEPSPETAEAEKQ